MEQNCPFCYANKTFFSKCGAFVRKSDDRVNLRYLCKSCGKTFSTATFQKCYRQKRRKINGLIRTLIASGVSQRKISRDWKINRKTVARKIEYLARLAKEKNQNQFLSGRTVYEMQFDDLETFEHTKLKPLSVTMAVEKNTRRILGFVVSQMPAKGHIAKKSVKKYGIRRDFRRQNRNFLFKELRPKISENCTIMSDKSPLYPESVKRHFPKAQHQTTPGRRGCVVGQGELKSGGFDPLFTLNHTFAMLRDNIKRLARRTWCTTKDPKMLTNIIEIYVEVHNNRIIPKCH